MSVLSREVNLSENHLDFVDRRMYNVLLGKPNEVAYKAESFFIRTRGFCTSVAFSDESALVR